MVMPGTCAATIMHWFHEPILRLAKTPGKPFAEVLRRPRFGELLDRIAQGEEIIITQHEKSNK
jgi:hypothetical protein